MGNTYVFGGSVEKPFIAQVVQNMLGVEAEQKTILGSAWKPERGFDEVAANKAMENLDFSPAIKPLGMKV